MLCKQLNNVGVEQGIQAKLARILFCQKTNPQAYLQQNSPAW